MFPFDKYRNSKFVAAPDFSGFAGNGNAFNRRSVSQHTVAAASDGRRSVLLVVTGFFLHAVRIWL